MREFRTPFIVFVLVLGLNVAQVLAQHDCYKCCGGGGSAFADVGHRACGEEPQEAHDCHVMDCPQEYECPGESCLDTYNDVCSENDEENPWECEDVTLHFCFGSGGV